MQYLALKTKATNMYNTKLPISQLNDAFMHNMTWTMLSVHKRKALECSPSGFFWARRVKWIAVVMRGSKSWSGPLRNWSLAFRIHKTAGTLYAKMKKASIIRQQKPSGTRFSGSSANCSFLAFFNDVKLAIARFVEDTMIFGLYVLLSAPSWSSLTKCQQSRAVEQFVMRQL